MGKILIHEHPDPAGIARRRAGEWMALTAEEQWRRLFQLIRLSIQLNGGKPLKEPRGNGLVIRKPKL